MIETLNATETIRQRRSIRKYKSGSTVSDEQIKLLLEAAMMAPSACNTRPWEFIVVQSREKLDEIASIHPYAKMLTSASIAIIVCALPEIQKGIAEGYFPQDCGAATQNILLQAAAIGLGTCWCGVYPKEERINELRKILELEEQKNIVPFNIIAVGVSDTMPDARGFYEADKVKFV